MEMGLAIMLGMCTIIGVLGAVIISSLMTLMCGFFFVPDSRNRIRNQTPQNQ